MNTSRAIATLHAGSTRAQMSLRATFLIASAIVSAAGVPAFANDFSTERAQSSEGAVASQRETARSVGPEVAQGQVHLYRDRWGMPHLYAAREEDGYFGLGYALAEDRLKQVLLKYLMVEGRLAEAFGPGPLSAEDDLSPELARDLPDTVASDLRMRQNQFLEHARQNLEQLTPQYQKNLKSFIAGMRHYMAQHPEKVPHWAPAIEPAMPLALYASYTMFDADLTCKSRSDAAQSAELIRGAVQNPKFASNAWAISPNRAKDGAVIFSSDSHGEISVGGPLFYTWRMHAGDLNVLSNDLTGTVAIVLAHTGNFAWGWTEGPRFTSDCYSVSVDPQNPDAYEFDGKVSHFEKKPYAIKVKGEKDVTGTFEYTRHNGVVSPVVERRGGRALVVSSSYSGLEGLAEGRYHQMAKARSFPEFMKALEPREIYPANLIVGGRDGSIFYIRPGRIPIRRPNVSVTEILDGNRSETSWLGYHALPDLVQLKDPPNGYLVNANVSPDSMFDAKLIDPDAYPKYFAFDPGQTNARQLRLMELVSGTRNATIDDAIRITLDDKVIGTDLWGAAIRKAMESSTFAADVASPEFDAFLKALTEFDGFFSADSLGAIPHATMRQTLVMSAPATVDEMVIAVEGGAPLSSDQNLALAKAVVDAFKTIKQKFGKAVPRYGEVYRAARGQFETGASGGYIVAGINLKSHLVIGEGDRKMSVRISPHASRYREDNSTGRQLMTDGTRIPFVVSFTAPIQSFGMTAFGSSNDETSPFYANQLPFAAGKNLKPNYFEYSQLEGNIVSTTVLTNSTRP